MSKRFYQQAIDTMRSNDCKPGDIIDAYNQKVIRGGIANYHDTTRGIQDSNIGSGRGKDDRQAVMEDE